MLICSVIMFITTVVLLLVGILVCRGHTELIHAYHQKNVTDKKTYGRAMGKTLIVFALPFAAAGVTAFFSDGILPTAVLFIGLLPALIALFFVQKKYNGGIF